MSDADIDSITDGITSNIDNILSIVKDLKYLEEPLEKIGFKIKAVKIELGLIPSVKFKIVKTDMSNLKGLLDTDQFSSLFGNKDSDFLNELSAFQKMFVKMLENLNVIEKQLNEYGYEIGEVETHATIPPKALMGSALSAFLKDSDSSLSIPTPHGLVCLIITTAPEPNSRTSSHAAFKSI